MKRLLLASSLGLVLLASAAQAMPMGAPDKHPNPDANNDGKVALAEFQKSHLDMMMTLDTNHDAKISEAEFMAMGGMMGHDGPPPPPAGKPKDHMDRKDHEEGDHHARMFDMQDRNNDGFVSADEIAAATAKRFKRMDKNSDGELSGDEIPHRGKGKGHDHHGHDDDHHGGPLAH